MSKEVIRWDGSCRDRAKANWRGQAPLAGSSRSGSLNAGSSPALDGSADRARARNPSHGPIWPEQAPFPSRQIPRRYIALGRRQRGKRQNAAETNETAPSTAPGEIPAVDGSVSPIAGQSKD